MIETRHRTTDPEKGTASTPLTQAVQTLAEDEMGSVLSNLDQGAEALESYKAATRRNPADALARVGQGNSCSFSTARPKLWLRIPRRRAWRLPLPWRMPGKAWP